MYFTRILLNYILRLLFLLHSATPTIASEPTESATSWVEKMRQMTEEKRKAAERVCIIKHLMNIEYSFDIFRRNTLNKWMKNLVLVI
jgi:hypothetical protein